MSRTPRRPRSRTWLRVLVLLLALWVPVAHAQAHAAPACAVSADTSEHHDGHDVTDALDGLDLLLRPTARAVHRADAPECPAPLPGPAAPARRPCPAASRAPYTTPLPRTVVLRC
ncbi:hypothetical protein [Streptomyces monashensis]|uniref:Secreted protein n=1 Tax=Streptomyces monashensis TaxID=1678012 RepID=A0A1S2QKI7_9ACTN|nr:hypothetical protein [Streptomyces monashensis]OIK05895.1 hypothetical protein BIV23_11375 [Streptomyces monashensis]